MKNFTKTHLLVAIASVAALLAGAAVAQAAASSNKTAVKNGVSWIRKSGLSQFPGDGTGFKSDTISALAAAKKLGISVPKSTTDKFIESVESDATNYAGTAGATSKLILAAVATGKNPKCFGTGGKSNLLNILKSNYDSSTGQYGETSFDHALALLALKAAHEKVPPKAVKFAKSRRGKYGWNFTLKESAGDDVESSALMIEALRAAGVSKSDGALKSAYKWITYQRNVDGGYNPDLPQGETQADTTSYAIRAADSLGKDNKDAKRALRALQKRGGSFRSSPSAAGSYPTISTTNAVLALSGQHFPVVVRSKAANSCV
jgi:hypothetical protein